MRHVLLSFGISIGIGLSAAAQVQTYRTIDGTDNNLTHTGWGGAHSELLRLTDVTYTDGIGAMITSPNARSVSNTVGVQTAPVDANPLNLSSMFWQWGQFLDHDLSLTGVNASEPHLIAVPDGDRFFTPGSFIPMSRSIHAHGSGETTARQFENEITHWIDASMVYGSDQARADALRSFTGGRLETGADGFMRRNYDAATNGLENENGPGAHDGTSFFLAGDVRANEQAGLTAMHEVFVRYHNAWADRLADENAGWTDEEIYQTARKIVGAQVQQITYEEWLPSMLGDAGLEHCTDHDRRRKRDDHSLKRRGVGLESYAGYDPSADPRLSVEFTTAVFRFGHTMLNERLLRLNEDGSTFDGGHLDLAGAFFRPDVITEDGGLDAILRGLIWQEANDLDTQVVEDVRSMLFGSPDNGGLDLLSLNIQRGRDHGIGTLNDLRAAFGLAKHKSFDDLTSNAELAALLAEVYDHVRDVDAWIGLMAEDEVNGGLLGETLTAAMLDQFERLRDGDRFFYLNDPELLPYLDEIQATSLGDILAAVTGADEFYGNVFAVGGGLTMPEPTSLAMLACGLVLLQRRRRGRYG